MNARTPIVPSQGGRAAQRVFAASERANRILIECLAPHVWRARAPGNVRTIAAIFSHMHNVRCKWVRLTEPHLPVPARLNRATCTPQQASAAFAQSAARCEEMLAEALDAPNGRIKHFMRDGWAKPWPVGAEMLCYMVAHEAHHRGQIALLAHQLGFPLPKAAMAEMWNWEKLWTVDGSSPDGGHDS